MPLLAALIGGAISSIASFLSLYITKRIAVIIALIVVLETITVAFFAAVTSIISGLSQVIPSAIVIGASWVWPANANVCIAAYYSVVLLRWAYLYNVKIIQWKLL